MDVASESVQMNTIELQLASILLVELKRQGFGQRAASSLVHKIISRCSTMERHETAEREGEMDLSSQSILVQNCRGMRLGDRPAIALIESFLKMAQSAETANEGKDLADDTTNKVNSSTVSPPPPPVSFLWAICLDDNDLSDRCGAHLITLIKKCVIAVDTNRAHFISSLNTGGTTSMPPVTGANKPEERQQRLLPLQHLSLLGNPLLSDKLRARLRAEEQKVNDSVRVLLAKSNSDSNSKDDGKNKSRRSGSSDFSFLLEVEGSEEKAKVEQVAVRAELLSVAAEESEERGANSDDNNSESKGSDLNSDGEEDGKEEKRKLKGGGSSGGAQVHVVESEQNGHSVGDVGPRNTSRVRNKERRVHIVSTRRVEEHRVTESHTRTRKMGALTRPPPAGATRRSIQVVAANGDVAEIELLKPYSQRPPLRTGGENLSNPDYDETPHLGESRNAPTIPLASPSRGLTVGYYPSSTRADAAAAPLLITASAGVGAEAQTSPTLFADAPLTSSPRQFARLTNREQQTTPPCLMLLQEENHDQGQQTESGFVVETSELKRIKRTVSEAEGLDMLLQKEKIKAVVSNEEKRKRQVALAATVTGIAAKVTVGGRRRSSASIISSSDDDMQFIAGDGAQQQEKSTSKNNNAATRPPSPPSAIESESYCFGSDGSNHSTSPSSDDNDSGYSKKDSPHSSVAQSSRRGKERKISTALFRGGGGGENTDERAASKNTVLRGKAVHDTDRVGAKNCARWDLQDYLDIAANSNPAAIDCVVNLCGVFSRDDDDDVSASESPALVLNRSTSAASRGIVAHDQLEEILSSLACKRGGRDADESTRHSEYSDEHYNAAEDSREAVARECAKEGSYTESFLELRRDHLSRGHQDGRGNAPAPLLRTTVSGSHAVTILNISGNNLKEIPRVLPHTLIRLDVSCNLITALRNLDMCPMLRVLNARRNQIRTLRVENDYDGHAANTSKSGSRNGIEGFNYTTTHARHISNSGGYHSSVTTRTAMMKERGGLFNNNKNRQQPTRAFDGNLCLAHLYLGHNLLRDLNGGAFAHLVALETLDVSYNPIGVPKPLVERLVAHYKTAIKKNTGDHYSTQKGNFNNTSTSSIRDDRERPSSSSEEGSKGRPRKQESIVRGGGGGSTAERTSTNASTFKSTTKKAEHVDCAAGHDKGSDREEEKEDAGEYSSDVANLTSLYPQSSLFAAATTMVRSLSLVPSLRHLLIVGTPFWYKFICEASSFAEEEILARKEPSSFSSSFFKAEDVRERVSGDDDHHDVSPSQGIDDALPLSSVGAFVSRSSCDLTKGHISRREKQQQQLRLSSDLSGVALGLHSGQAITKGNGRINTINVSYKSFEKAKRQQEKALQRLAVVVRNICPAVMSIDNRRLPMSRAAEMARIEQDTLLGKRAYGEGGGVSSMPPSTTGSGPTLLESFSWERQLAGVVEDNRMEEMMSWVRVFAPPSYTLVSPSPFYPLLVGTGDESASNYNRNITGLRDPRNPAGYAVPAKVLQQVENITFHGHSVCIVDTVDGASSRNVSGSQQLLLLHGSSREDSSSFQREPFHDALLNRVGGLQQQREVVLSRAGSAVAKASTAAADALRSKQKEALRLQPDYSSIGGGGGVVRPLGRSSSMVERRQFKIAGSGKESGSNTTHSLMVISSSSNKKRASSSAEVKGKGPAVPVTFSLNPLGNVKPPSRSDEGLKALIEGTKGLSGRYNYASAAAVTTSFQAANSHWPDTPHKIEPKSNAAQSHEHSNGNKGTKTTNKSNNNSSIAVRSFAAATSSSAARSVNVGTATSAITTSSTTTDQPMSTSTASVSAANRTALAKAAEAKKLAHLTRRDQTNTSSSITGSIYASFHAAFEKQNTMGKETNAKAPDSSDKNNKQPIPVSTHAVVSGLNISRTHSITRGGKAEAVVSRSGSAIGSSGNGESSHNLARYLAAESSIDVSDEGRDHDDDNDYNVNTISGEETPAPPHFSRVYDVKDRRLVVVAPPKTVALRELYPARVHGEMGIEATSTTPHRHRLFPASLAACAAAEAFKTTPHRATAATAASGITEHRADLMTHVVLTAEAFVEEQLEARRREEEAEMREEEATAARYAAWEEEEKRLEALAVFENDLSEERMRFEVAESTSRQLFHEFEAKKRATVVIKEAEARERAKEVEAKLANERAERKRKAIAEALRLQEEEEAVAEAKAAVERLKSEQHTKKLAKARADEEEEKRLRQQLLAETEAARIEKERIFSENAEAKRQLERLAELNEQHTAAVLKQQKDLQEQLERAQKEQLLALQAIEEEKIRKVREATAEAEAALSLREKLLRQEVEEEERAAAERRRVTRSGITDTNEVDIQTRQKLLQVPAAMKSVNDVERFLHPLNVTTNLQNFTISNAFVSPPTMLVGEGSGVVAGKFTFQTPATQAEDEVRGGSGVESGVASLSANASGNPFLSSQLKSPSSWQPISLTVGGISSPVFGVYQPPVADSSSIHGRLTSSSITKDNDDQDQHQQEPPAPPRYGHETAVPPSSQRTTVVGAEDSTANYEEVRRAAVEGIDEEKEKEKERRGYDAAAGGSALTPANNAYRFFAQSRSITSPLPYDTTTTTEGGVTAEPLSSLTALPHCETRREDENTKVAPTPSRPVFADPPRLASSPSSKPISATHNVVLMSPSPSSPRKSDEGPSAFQTSKERPTSELHNVSSSPPDDDKRGQGGYGLFAADAARDTPLSFDSHHHHHHTSSKKARRASSSSLINSAETAITQQNDNDNSSSSNGAHQNTTRDGKGSHRDEKEVKGGAKGSGGIAGRTPTGQSQIGSSGQRLSDNDAGNDESNAKRIVAIDAAFANKSSSLPKKSVANCATNDVPPGEIKNRGDDVVSSFRNLLALRDKDEKGKQEGSEQHSEDSSQHNEEVEQPTRQQRQDHRQILTITTANDGKATTFLTKDEEGHAANENTVFDNPNILSKPVLNPTMLSLVSPPEKTSSNSSSPSSAITTEEATNSVLAKETSMMTPQPHRQKHERGVASSPHTSSSSSSSSSSSDATGHSGSGSASSPTDLRAGLLSPANEISSPAAAVAGDDRSATEATELDYADMLELNDTLDAPAAMQLAIAMGFVDPRLTHTQRKVDPAAAGNAAAFSLGIKPSSPHHASSGFNNVKKDQITSDNTGMLQSRSSLQNNFVAVEEEDSPSSFNRRLLGQREEKGRERRRTEGAEDEGVGEGRQRRRGSSSTFMRTAFPQTDEEYVSNQRSRHNNNNNSSIGRNSSSTFQNDTTGGVTGIENRKTLVAKTGGGGGGKNIAHAEEKASGGGMGKGTTIREKTEEEKEEEGQEKSKQKRKDQQTASRGDNKKSSSKSKGSGREKGRGGEGGGDMTTNNTTTTIISHNATPFDVVVLPDGTKRLEFRQASMQSVKAIERAAEKSRRKEEKERKRKLQKQMRQTSSSSSSSYSSLSSSVAGARRSASSSSFSSNDSAKRGRSARDKRKGVKKGKNEENKEELKNDKDLRKIKQVGEKKKKKKKESGQGTVSSREDANDHRAQEEMEVEEADQTDERKAVDVDDGRATETTILVGGGSFSSHPTAAAGGSHPRHRQRQQHSFSSADAENSGNGHQTPSAAEGVGGRKTATTTTTTNTTTTTTSRLSSQPTPQTPTPTTAVVLPPNNISSPPSIPPLHPTTKRNPSPPVSLEKILVVPSPSSPPSNHRGADKKRDKKKNRNSAVVDGVPRQKAGDDHREGEPPAIVLSLSARQGQRRMRRGSSFLLSPAPHLGSSSSSSSYSSSTASGSSSDHAPVSTSKEKNGSNHRRSPQNVTKQSPPPIREQRKKPSSERHQQREKLPESVSAEEEELWELRRKKIFASTILSPPPPPRETSNVGVSLSPQPKMKAGVRDGFVGTTTTTTLCVPPPPQEIDGVRPTGVGLARGPGGGHTPSPLKSQNSPSTLIGAMRPSITEPTAVAFEGQKNVQANNDANKLGGGRYSSGGVPATTTTRRLFLPPPPPSLSAADDTDTLGRPSTMRLSLYPPTTSKDEETRYSREAVDKTTPKKMQTEDGEISSNSKKVSKVRFASETVVEKGEEEMRERDRKANNKKEAFTLAVSLLQPEDGPLFSTLSSRLGKDYVNGLWEDKLAVEGGLRALTEILTIQRDLLKSEILRSVRNDSAKKEGFDHQLWCTADYMRAHFALIQHASRSRLVGDHDRLLENAFQDGRRQSKRHRAPEAEEDQQLDGTAASRYRVLLSEREACLALLATNGLLKPAAELWSPKAFVERLVSQRLDALMLEWKAQQKNNTNNTKVGVSNEHHEEKGSSSSSYQQIRKGLRKQLRAELLTEALDVFARDFEVYWDSSSSQFEPLVPTANEVEVHSAEEKEQDLACSSRRSLLIDVLWKNLSDGRTCLQYLSDCVAQEREDLLMSFLL